MITATPCPEIISSSFAGQIEKAAAIGQNIWWFVGIITGLIILLFRLGFHYRHAVLRIQVLERDVSVQQHDIEQLLICNLAILDGLMQMNCNGMVVKSRNNLREYLAGNRIVHIKEER